MTQYVEVTDQNLLRKDVLQSSKDILDALKRIDHLASLRENKQHVITSLKKTVSEILLLHRKLRSYLPETGVSVIAKGKRGSSKLQVIEEELSAIESKLAALE